VVGSTVFSRKQLAKQVAPYIGKELTFEEIFQIREAISTLYTNAGYVTSGAFIPVQDLSSGVVQIQVVEGQLERIEIQGLRHLDKSYIRARLRRAGGAPLNVNRLENALQLLQSDPIIAHINANLVAGSIPGRNILQVRVKEAPFVHAGLTVDNSQAPSIGSNEVSPFLRNDDLLGFGDRLSGTYGYTSGLRSYDVSYTIPVNAEDGTVNIQYSNFDARVIEPPFDVVGITSKERTLSVGFRQPLVRRPASEFALSLSLDLRRERTFILNNIPFSFTTGPQNGVSKLTVIRFAQDWVHRRTHQVLAARSQFSVGLGALGATVNNSGTDGRFFDWVGEFQDVQSLGGNVVSVARVAIQLTPNSLLPIEQFSIGGIGTVRGYRQNQLLADNGVLGSYEIRIPVTPKPNVLQIIPFFDLGTVWNNLEADPYPTTLASVGLGLNLAIGSDLNLSIDFGAPLISVHNLGHSLQDDGIFFSVKYQPF